MRTLPLHRPCSGSRRVCSRWRKSTMKDKPAAGRHASPTLGKFDGYFFFDGSRELEARQIRSAQTRRCFRPQRRGSDAPRHACCGGLPLRPPTLYRSIQALLRSQRAEHQATILQPAGEPDRKAQERSVSSPNPHDLSRPEPPSNNIGIPVKCSRTRGQVRKNPQSGSRIPRTTTNHRSSTCAQASLNTV